MAKRFPLDVGRILQPPILPCRTVNIEIIASLTTYGNFSNILSQPVFDLKYFYVQSTPPPLVDWTCVPTLVLAVILVMVAATALVARAADGKQTTRLPGPQALPFLGTRWLFWSRYKMNKLHEAYEGEIFIIISTGHCCKCKLQGIKRHQIYELIDE